MPCGQLRYDAQSAGSPDRPGFVRAASGAAVLGQEMVIVQDDVSFLAIRGAAGTVRAVALPPGPDGLRRFERSLGNEHRKMDLESAVTVGTRVIAFGSGSRPVREIIVVYDPRSHPTVHVVEAGRFYARLRANRGFAGSELNVEGAAVVGSDLRLFQRGNGAPRGDLRPVDATVDIDLRAFLRWLDDGGGGEPPPLGDVHRYDLGSIRGVPFGFTGATTLRDGRIAILASAEDSPDVVRDGTVLGSRVGLMDGRSIRWVELGAGVGLLPVKAEGIVPRRGPDDDVWVVTDPDNPNRPAQLCLVELP